MKFRKKRERKMEFIGRPIETLRRLVDWRLKYHRRAKVTRMEEQNDEDLLTVRVYYRKRLYYHTPILHKR
jgi:hypothetical protein